MDADLGRRDDAQADTVPADAEDPDLHAIANHDGFVPSAREDKHGLLGVDQDVAQWIEAVVR